MPKAGKVTGLNLDYQNQTVTKPVAAYFLAAGIAAKKKRHQAWCDS